MTKAALNVLDDNPDGFVFVVEGGAVDWAGHGRTLGRLIEEQIDFDNAVQAVVDWIKNNSNWGETLLIVTGDHETGFLWGPDVDPENESTWFSPVVDNGPGAMPGGFFYSAPGDDWQDPSYSAGHTNQVIPFYVHGNGQGRLLRRAQGEDPVHGDYLDNTDVAEAIFEMLKAVEDRQRDIDTTAQIASINLDNFPNPFNPMTTISFSLPKPGNVTLKVFDIRGHLVKSLVDGHLDATTHEVQWNGTDNQGRQAASGVYYCMLQTDGQRESRKLILAK
jgi:hypothetical protein